MTTEEAHLSNFVNLQGAFPFHIKSIVDAVEYICMNMLPGVTKALESSGVIPENIHHETINMILNSVICALTQSKKGSIN